MVGEQIMIKVVRFEKEDLNAFTDIAFKSFEEDKNTYGQYPPLIDSEHHRLRYIHNSLTFKILSDRKMVGGILIFNNGNGIYTLGAIFIDPAFQDQGIGQQVIRLIEAKFPDAKKWKLDTPYRSFRNHYFYEKMEYVKTDEVTPDKNDVFKLFIYEKTMD